MIVYVNITYHCLYIFIFLFGDADDKMVIKSEKGIVPTSTWSVMNQWKPLIC